MDNFHIDITSEGSINAAMRIAFSGRSHKASFYKVSATKGLVFGWSDSMRDGIKLPFSLDADGAADFATRWLAEQDYGKEPDHDGDNGKGWRLYNESWGHVDDDWAAFVAVKPAWAMYGK